MYLNARLRSCSHATHPSPPMFLGLSLIAICMLVSQLQVRKYPDGFHSASMKAKMMFIRVLLIVYSGAHAGLPRRFIGDTMNSCASAQPPPFIDGLRQYRSLFVEKVSHQTISVTCFIAFPPKDMPFPNAAYGSDAAKFRWPHQPTDLRTSRSS